MMHHFSNYSCVEQRTNGTHFLTSLVSQLIRALIVMSPLVVLLSSSNIELNFLKRSLNRKAFRSRIWKNNFEKRYETNSFDRTSD